MKRRQREHEMTAPPSGTPCGSTIPALDRLPSVRLALADLHLSDALRTDGQDNEHIRTLAETDAGLLPPIVVQQLNMRVIDGNHRVRAAALRGEDHIWARLFDGDDSAAFVLSVSLNVSHGLPLTLGDRRAAAARIMRAHPQWSDRSIAGTTGLAAKTVAGVRARALTEHEQARDRLGRDGRVRPIDRISRRAAAADILNRHPQASLRSVASEVGLSPETVRDVRMRLQRGEDATSPKRTTNPVPIAPDDTLYAASDRVKPRRDQVAQDVGAEALRADPALRYSESGRALIRLLEAHRFSDQTWQTLLDTVPPHCADIVASTAHACAQRWLRFAEEVSYRDSVVEDKIAV